MDFTGKPMAGGVFAGLAGSSDDPKLEEWVGRGQSYVLSLPPK
jgi:hypothetical protein